MAAGHRYVGLLHTVLVGTGYMLHLFYKTLDICYTYVVKYKCKEESL